jgi:hypothetical protein
MRLPSVELNDSSQMEMTYQKYLITYSTVIMKIVGSKRLRVTL